LKGGNTVKRILGGFLFVLVVVSLAASVCLADINGPWIPRTSAASITRY
jgi:hypothetical protein